VVVTDDDVRFDTYREHGTGTFVLANRFYASDKEETIAFTNFEEPAEDTQNWSPGAGDQELGFTTTKADNPPGRTIDVMGVYDSSTSPTRYRMRTVDGEVTFDTVDISEYWDVVANIRIAIKETTWEAGDFFEAIVKNASDEEISLALVEGNDLEDLITTDNGDYFMWFRAEIPDDWDEVTLIIRSFTNSSADRECVDFDSVLITGIPEPSTMLLLTLGAAALLRKRRL